MSGGSVSQDYGAATSAAAAAAGVGGTLGVTSTPYVQALAVSPIDLTALLSDTFGPRAGNPTNLPIDRIEQMRDTLVGRDPYRETQDAGNPHGRVQGLFPGLGLQSQAADAAPPFLGTVNAVDQRAYLASLQPVRPASLPTDGGFALLAVAESRPALKPAQYQANLPQLQPISYAAGNATGRLVGRHHATSAGMHFSVHPTHFQGSPNESAQEYGYRIDPMATMSHSDLSGTAIAFEVRRLAAHHNAQARSMRIGVAELARRNLAGHGHSRVEIAFYHAVINYVHHHPTHTLLPAERGVEHFLELLNDVRGAVSYPPSERANALLVGAAA